MMFFKRKPALIQARAATVSKPVHENAEIAAKAIRKNDSDGRLRRLLRTVEDNRLL